MRNSKSNTPHPYPFGSIRVNPTRLRSDFDNLAQIGASAKGGINRSALSEAHLAAREWFMQHTISAGLDFRKDGAGNHSALLPGNTSEAPTILLGSHLDSVPNGGKYDGALGVLAALESLRVIQENNLSLPVNLEAIDFTDEEGTFIGLLGSSALAGNLTREALRNPRGGRQKFISALEYSGITEEGFLTAAREPETIAGYLELHIEQGSYLVEAGADIGIVSSIVGISSIKLTFIGRADHAGTTRVQNRLDAAQGASAFTLAVRELILEDFPRCVANVGQMCFSPGAFNIVPESVEVALELRAGDPETLERLENALMQVAQREAHRFSLGLKIEHLDKHLPQKMSARIQEVLINAVESLGLRYIKLDSGAGHDAQSLVDVCLAGMLFVPSVGGVSHSPREFTEWKDCLNGANVLLQAGLQLAFQLE